MSKEVKITYVNQTQDNDLVVGIFGLPNPGSGTPPWQTIENIGHGGQRVVIYPWLSQAQMRWDDGRARTAALGVDGNEDSFIFVSVESSYQLERGGNELPGQITIHHQASSLRGSATACVLKDGMPLLQAPGIHYGMTAAFEVVPRLYWGLIKTEDNGIAIITAVEILCELELTGLSRAIVTLEGDEQSGYKMTVSGKE